MLHRKLNQKLTSYFYFLFAIGRAAYARRDVLLTWNGNSDDEEGFVVERTVSDDCVGGWEMIAYTGINQNFVEDIYIPGACYRVAAYNQLGPSTYSNIVRAPLWLLTILFLASIHPAEAQQLKKVPRIGIYRRLIQLLTPPLPRKFG